MPLRRQSWQAALRLLLAVFFVGAGTLHFATPSFYLAIMPPYLPYHLELVYVSGVCEILGGLGVLVRPLRRAAGYGLLALLIAVFPANIHMAAAVLQGEGLSSYAVLLLVRLPFQLVLAAWVYFCSLASAESTGK